MANKSVAALSSLMSLSAGAQQAQDSESIIDRLDPEPGVQAQPDSDSEGKAKFDKAEAIALGVLTSFIAGPAVGIAIGAAHGVAKRKADQGILDRAANERNAFTESFDILNDDISQRVALAKQQGNAEDVATLGTIRDGLLLAQKGMVSGNPETRAQSAMMLDQTRQELLTFSRTNETQRIAQDVRDESRRNELDAQQETRYTQLQADYDARSAPFAAVAQSGKMALEAIANGDPADIHAAIIALNKTLDPASVVRGEEVESFKAMHSAFANAVQTADQWLTGDPMGSAQKRQLAALTQRILTNSSEFHKVMEAQFGNRLSDANIDIKYNDNFRDSKSYPVAAPFTIEPDTSEKSGQLVDDTADAISGGIDAANEFSRDLLDSVGAGTNAAIEATGKFFDEVSPYLKREPEWPRNRATN